MTARRPATVRLGAGAGFAGDRIDPAIALARYADLNYLIFECLGERTVAAAQARKQTDPRSGYDPMLDDRLRAVLPTCVESGTTIITNAGAAHPEAAGELAAGIASELGMSGLRIAVVTGDDALDLVRREDPTVWETGTPTSALQGVVSANAYLGADGIVEALSLEPDLVITGRTADPSLYLGPLRYEFGWSHDAYELLGRGTLVGHLLECAGQLTGGYFADPVTKPVPDMAGLGFPFADVDPDGGALLGKLPTTGGRLDVQTCREQLLYEVDDPGAYITPDVVADFSEVSFTQEAQDRVTPRGATGRERPDSLKVTLGLDTGWLGEGQLSYAGPRCLERAQLAANITRERLHRVHGVDPDEVSIELIGTGAAFHGLAASSDDPSEVRLRVTLATPDKRIATAVGWEVESLYTNGPAGGGGARKGVTKELGIQSCLLPRHLLSHCVDVTEAP